MTKLGFNREDVIADCERRLRPYGIETDSDSGEIFYIAPKGSRAAVCLTGFVSALISLVLNREIHRMEEVEKCIDQCDD